MPTGIYQRTKKHRIQSIENLKNWIGRIPPMKGKHHKEETKKKIREKRAKQIIVHSEKTKEKIRKNHARYWKGKKGDKHPKWNGGSSFEPYSVDWTETLKRGIRERDNYICQLCRESA